jgi:hypothetical protein
LSRDALPTPRAAQPWPLGSASPILIHRRPKWKGKWSCWIC